MNAAELKTKLDELHAILTTIKGRKIDSVQALDDDAYQFRYLACWPQHGIPVSCYAQIDPGMNLFLFRGVLDVPFEPPERALAAEYILRINYPLPIGNWAMDGDSGEVRFKLGFCFGHETLTKHLMLTHIDAACYFIDEHIMGFLRVLNGGSVEEAVRARGT
jgi:hypothetical protein